MKRLPIILLALMALLFAFTLNRPEDWAGWLRAFAEAGMVGALADWFAVVALFRRPLGLPIPHTAIIPNRKDQIGENLARFVAGHFLQEDVLRERLVETNLAGNAALWLDSLIREGRHRDMLTRSLRIALVALHDNREAIRCSVQAESPWWLPGFVDDRILVQMLDRVEIRLLELSLDPDHPVRRDIDEQALRWAEAVRASAVPGESAYTAEAEWRAWLNDWLVNATVAVVVQNRDAIAGLISGTVRSWDGAETGRRIEQAVGRDLQFIRVNGTLVGGLVGLAIHAVKVL